MAVLISIKPKWCELIANGKKTIDVRKTRPKCDVPFKCYIYCTNDRKTMLERSNYDKSIYLNGNIYYPHKMDCSLNGKVIGEFVCDYIMRHCNMQNADLAEQQGLIKRELLFKYSNGKELFGWHISDLKIYDKPKELNEFSSNSCGLQFSSDGKRFVYNGMIRPPQSWCYVCERGD